MALSLCCVNRINPDNSSRRRFLVSQRDIPNWVSVARVGLTVKDFVNPTRYHRAIPSRERFPRTFCSPSRAKKRCRRHRNLSYLLLQGRRPRFLNDLTCRQVDLILDLQDQACEQICRFMSHSNTSDQENRSSKRRSYSILHQSGTGLHLVVHRAPLLVPGTHVAHGVFLGHGVLASASISSNNRCTRFHVSIPRGSEYLSGYRMIS